MASGDRQNTSQKPSGKKEKELSQDEQSERFKKTARELGADEKSDRLEQVITKLKP